MVFHTELMIRLARAPKSLSLGRGDTPDTDPDMTWLSTMIQKPQADHGFPSAAISALAPARIAKLRPESLARGRVLHGVLIADALMLEDSVQVLTTLRDSRGDEVLLAIKHAVASDATAEQVRAKYPRGARVAVKEPMLHKHHGSFISLDNPANVEVISYLSDEQLERFAGMAPAALRVEGNKLFQDGSFEAAAQAYALSAVKCEQEEERDRVLALSNQAESFFKLGRYEQCVDAASAALAVDPRHLKSLYRKALALLNLQCYEWSCRLLSDVLGVDEAVDQLHKRCQNLAIQSKDINSIMADIHSFYRAWSEREQAPLFPEVADNVCQVEVKKCEDQSKQRGRGLFATTNIKKGELVLTSNSAAFERGGNISVCNRNAAIRFQDMAMKSPRAYKQIHSLASMAAGNEREVPAMELFQADWATPENWSSVSTDSSREALEGISVERVFETVSVASFNPTGPGPDENTQRLLYVGTWLIPSFINHCCVGNVCQRLFGTTVCYFATRDIQAGEELGHCYIIAGHPYRRTRLDFECACKKCELERQLDEDLAEVTGCYRDLAESNFEFRLKGETDIPGMVAKLEKVLATKLQEEEDRQCMRAVHWSFYLIYYQKLRRGNVVALPEGMVPAGEVIMEAMHRFSAGNLCNKWCLEMMAECARDKEAARRVMEMEVEVLFGKQENACVAKAIYERGMELIAQDLMC